ncbi:MAG TPA: hypothetical protein VG603_08360, partial [Chitinophagales bacterium]|nr:hypothetical protein [Chitinophagales bacterium]
MKKALPFFLSIVYAIAGHAQQMQVKIPNFSTFKTDSKSIPPALEKNSSEQARKHPEYGILPYNTQCSNCVELIDGRTLTSRQFIDTADEGQTYSQQSYFPLHYKNSADDVWHTIDPRLRPDAIHPGVYTAPHQPVPTTCNLNTKSTTLKDEGYEFEFNKNLQLFFFDESVAYTKTETGNYSNYTIGEEGLLVKNMWPGIDMQQQFKRGEIKTNYVIKAPLYLPISKGWMVIEDHFTLPEGFTIEESAKGIKTPEGYYRGDYEIKDATGQVHFTYAKPIYIDAKAFGQHGLYKLLRNGNNYTLQTMVPVEWLNRKDNTYPLYIDPDVTGQTRNGNFRSTGQTQFDAYAFTTKSIGFCTDSMVVNVPGASQVTSAWLDLEYELTYDNTCGTPPLPAPYCTFSQVRQQVICEQCNTSTGFIGCNPALPPYTGTCTTDPNLVPGAHSILINSLNPNFLSCIQQQCSDYQLNFILQNQDSICGDVCGYLCARGNMWVMTIGANRIQGTVQVQHSYICQGQTDVLTAHALYGVPPYYYAWSIDDGNTFQTIYGDSTYVIQPQQDVIVECIMFDTCHIPAYSNQTPTMLVPITIIPGPVIEVGATLDATPGFTNYQWFLNGNPIPGDTTRFCTETQPGTYTVQASNGTDCTEMSAPFIVAGVENTNSNPLGLSIIPNPSQGNFVVRCTAGKSINNAGLKLIDVTGRV